ncbi:hypothetical protein E4U26_007102, partial [Claviceps purpurea]
MAELRKSEGLSYVRPYTVSNSPRQYPCPGKQRPATRLRTLDAYHPLTTRAWDADTPVRRAISQRRIRAPAGHNSNRYKGLSRLRRVPCTELLPPAPPAPDPTNGLSKEELRKDPPDADAVVYSDGSKESGDDAGFG